MKSDLKKPVVITTIIIIYILKNWRKKGRKKLSNKVNRKVLGDKMEVTNKKGNPFKNILYDDP